ncbi:PKD domain-containing protein [Flavobacterium quisquiliarum]|uniref:PKD domain-containing protein n=1 Tax=Flavobacterium quisquiliarum TaxID=1834436 RepID=A0ABV8W4B2_9FLAO|nr:PKD domain-containing protein [Flavobacterium quisquiliarum]MBW1655513.1 PKD domain-containing protein [Flavobacterium quisquiliarum]NWL03137.1 hypothetical protein [Flavobacterium collinsii]
MKNYLQKLACLIISLVLLACSFNDGLPDEPQEQPIAAFSHKSDGKSPTKIDFLNESINATNYLWDFGDNTTSLEKNPSHTYIYPGTYIVELNISGSGGIAVIKKIIIISAQITPITPTTPTTVKITKVTVAEMPFSDENGNKWDSFNVQFSIVDEETYKDQTSSSVFKNISKTQLPLSWTLSSPKVITDLSKEYEFSISRIEGLFGYRIGGHMFAKMIDYTTGTNKYPNTITLEYNDPSVPNQKVTFILDINWQ